VEARSLSVTGVVQRVGFQPFLHRLAVEHELVGWVRNESGDVRIVVEGPADRLDARVGALQRSAPPIARIDDVTVAIIGTVVKAHPGTVALKTAIGGSRVVDMLPGGQLPRIC
jgi:hydrogenase maturation protein HypF